jgi:beta-lactamase class A
LYAATVLVALLLLVSSCASAATQASTLATSSAAPTARAPAAAPPTAAPTATVLPTAVPTIADGVQIAGVDVGGLTREAARDKLDDALAAQMRPLDVQFGDTKLSITTDAIALAIAFDDMLAQAQSATAGAQVPLALHYDEAKLRELLNGLVKQSGEPASVSVITSTDSISRSFALSGGATLDLDAAVEQIDEQLRAAGGARRVTLAPAAAADAARPTPEQLQEQLETMAKGFKGTLGVYIYDLASAKQIAGLNERTAFTAASTIKLAILLNAYINVPKFNAKQTEAIRKMVVESDNLKANDVMAAAAGGTSTESAFKGAEQMSAMLAELGLKNTFLFVPFESGDFIKLYKVKFKTGPKQGGEAPFTPASNTLRTTPYEMAQLYVYIEQCSRGEGVLLEKFGEHLSAARCQEMIGWLKKNGDTKRMMSGLPKGADVAHKSGWIPPVVQGDAGIVRSPGGDFIIAIYIYQPGERYSDKAVQTLIGNFARLAYTYYNPIVTH